MPRFFSPAEDAKIIEMHDAGATWLAILPHLNNRTVGGVRRRHQDITRRLLACHSPKDPRVKIRDCMTCKRRFRSQHNGNRMCNACRNLAQDVSPLEPLSSDCYKSTIAVPDAAELPGRGH